MELKKLKVATPRMAGYTGVLGVVRFVDGVSTEYLPRHIRDRMAAGMEFIEIDKEGKEQPAGAQYRMISRNAERAALAKPLVRQSEAEKVEELTKDAIAAGKEVLVRSRAELIEIASKSGMKGLREVAATWGAKHRSIPALIEMILEAQERHTAARHVALAQKIEAENATHPVSAEQVESDAAKIETDLDVDAQAPADAPTEEVAVGEPVVDEKTSIAASKIGNALKDAAASGDLAAAISSDQTDQG